VLDTFLFADRELLRAHPWLRSADVLVHFQSAASDLDAVEHWGSLGDRRSWQRMPKGVAARLRLLLRGFPEGRRLQRQPCGGLLLREAGGGMRRWGAEQAAALGRGGALGFRGSGFVGDSSGGGRDQAAAGAAAAMVASGGDPRPQAHEVPALAAHQGGGAPAAEAVGAGPAAAAAAAGDASGGPPLTPAPAPGRAAAIAVAVAGFERTARAGSSGGSGSTSGSGAAGSGTSSGGGSGGSSLPLAPQPVAVRAGGRPLAFEPARAALATGRRRQA
jgi:hypothetical protein